MTKRFRFVSPGEVLVGVVFDHHGKIVQNIKKLHDYQYVARMGDYSGVANFPVYCEFTPEHTGQPDMVNLSNPELKILECA